MIIKELTIRPVMTESGEDLIQFRIGKEVAELGFFDVVEVANALAKWGVFDVMEVASVLAELGAPRTTAQKDRER